MNKALSILFGIGVLTASAAASAQVSVHVGINPPGRYYAPAAPVYVAPPRPMAVGYYGDGGRWGGPGPDWRRREWEHRQWVEHHRREEWRREHGYWR